MNKILYILSVIVLALAGYLFILSGIKWLDVNRGTHESHVSIINTFKTMGTISNNNAEKISPLVEKAMEFALYLNPPQIAEPEVLPTIIEKLPDYRPTNITPKFRLLSVSYYISNPEASVALVSEPGKGDHWIRKGERVGNFVVEDIQKGSIIYRNDDQLVSMNVSIKQNIPIAKPQEPKNPEYVRVADLSSFDKRVMENIFEDTGNPEDEYSSPVRSVRQNSKKNVRPSLRLLYASQPGEKQK